MLGTVCRAGDLLELFDPQSPEWGATAVSRKLAITKSQAHEMLVSLESIGLLRRAGRGRFRLGWRTLILSQRLMRSEFTVEETQLVRRLARHTEAFAELTTFDGRRFVRVAASGPGERPEITAERPGPCGKVLLASSPAAPEGLARPDREAELAAVRLREVAFEEGAERCGVAAPVRGPDGSVRAALGLTVAAGSWPGKRAVLVTAVKGTAQRLSGAAQCRDPEAAVEVGVPQARTDLRAAAASA